MSPLIFNLVMDGLIESLPSGIGYRMGGQTISCIAYADDIVLFASTKEGLQELLDVSGKYLRNCGLEIDAEKSRTLAHQGQPKQKRQVVLEGQVFMANNRRLAAMNRRDKWKYLGIDFDGDGRTKYLDDVAPVLKRLDKSPLKPQQKLFALRTCLIPRMFHKLSLGLVSLGRLRTLDIAVRDMVRTWLRLPGDVPIAHFHGAISDGGLGLPSLRWFAPMLRYKRLDRIISSNNIYDGYLTRQLAVAQTQTANDDLNLRSSESIRGMWANRLHAYFDEVNAVLDAEGSRRRTISRRLARAQRSLGFVDITP